MAKIKKQILDAGVCRDIVRELIDEQGPLTITSLYGQIKKVFRVNSAYMVTTLTTSDGGFSIVNGLVYADTTVNVRWHGNQGNLTIHTRTSKKATVQPAGRNKRGK